MRRSGNERHFGRRSGRRNDLFVSSFVLVILTRVNN